MTVRHIAGVALSLIVGIIVGATGGFVQAQRTLWTIGEFSLVLPWGAVLVVVVLAIVVRGAVVALHGRWAGWLVLVGWLLTTAWLTIDDGSGDVAVSVGPRQLGYLVGGILLAVVAVTLPLPATKSAASID